MSEEQPQRPTTDDRDAWRAYWTTLEMPWRTEPEIDEQRQAFLTERRAVTPDIEKGIYPFRDQNGSIKLTRADVEWLLATHESGGMRGPVDWSDAKQRFRKGLDVRGADLCGVDLGSEFEEPGLPLTCLRAGLALSEWVNSPVQQRNMAAARLQETSLRHTHLEQADLRGVRLDRADLRTAQLVQANLTAAHLECADLRLAHLEGAYMRGARLDGADLRNAFLDTGTRLDEVILGSKGPVFARLADVRWGSANLAVVSWAPLARLGDEYAARTPPGQDGETKKERRTIDFEAAVRANRQLATALRDQGLNEDADRFAYRAQVLQRVVLFRQVFLRVEEQPQGPWWQLRKLTAYLGSWFLAIIAGYGYRPGRSILAYLLLVSGFAAAYFVLGAPSGAHLNWYEALVVSLTAFHGRGFFAQQYAPGDPQSIIAAAEAVVGLLIEISFIATFTQRFLGK